MPLRPRQWLKGFAIAAAAVVVLCGLLLGAFQIAIARVPEYRVQLQTWIGERTGLVIEFSKLSARLRAYGPELVFHDAVVRTPDRSIVLASARRGSMGLDLWASVSTGRLTAGRFSLDSPEIGLIRTRDGHIELVGQSALPERDVQSFALENLPVGRFRVSDAIVSFRDEATGRGPWALSGVSFNLNRQPHAVEVAGDAALPAALGKSLEFSGRASGALEESHAVVSSFSIEGDELDLAGWADLLPDEWPAPETGRGSVLVSGTLRGAQLASLNAKVDFRKVAAVAPVWTVELPTAEPLRIKQEEGGVRSADTNAAVVAPAAPPAPTSPPTTPEMLSYERIACNVVANRIDNGWKLSASDVEVLRGKEDWRAGALEAQWTRTAEGASTLAAKADHVRLQNLWPLLAYFPESESLARIRALQVRGSIDDLSLTVQRASAAEPPQYSLQADIGDLGVNPVLRTPGVTGLSGRVTATQAGGQLQLDSDDVRFELPRMFRWPLQAQSLQAIVAWERAGAGWKLSSDRVNIQSADGSVAANFTLTLPGGDASPMLELRGTARDVNPLATHKYLPADRLSPKALEWLDRAFVAGRVREAQIHLGGPVRAFPFRGGEGEFLISAQVEGMTFDYQPGWQPATNMNAQVEFRNQGMRVRSGTAALGGLRIVSLGGEFADFKTGDIAVNAVAAGDLDHALKLLQTSPIRAALGDTFQRLHGRGEAQSRVNLFLPLKRMGDRRIGVVTQLKDSTVTIDGVDGPITQLSGTLRVRQSLPDMADLQGQWLGGPLAVTVASEDKSNRAQVLAKGQASAAGLATLLHLPATVRMNGSTPWQFSTQLASGPGTRFAEKFIVDASLAGLSLELPYPVGKTADAARPLRLELEYPKDDALLARSSMGSIRALVRMQRTADGWSLDRGGVRADAIAAALPDHRGLRVEGSLDRLKLDDWFALRSPAASTATGSAAAGTDDAKRLSDYLHAISLRVGTVQLYGYEWADVRGIMQATRSGWQVDLAGPNAAGSLLIPEEFSGNQPLNASLERLIITSLPKEDAAEAAQKAAKPSDPRSWPALRVFIANLAVDTHSIGTVDLRTSRVPAGIKVDQLTLVQGSLQGSASGQWLMTGEGERSSLSAKVTSTDVGATLRALNYTQFIEAKRGEIAAELSWPGGFDGDFLGQASGTLTVNAENGQLLNVQPGAGRVLGLFSVAALPRRLALDFSDLTDKGLSFDSVHGDFELRNGDAFTTNLLLRGPAAEIGIAGRTGLGAHDYDQTAVVTGNLGVTLPVAGALAGGPAVGAALLLFSRVFKEPLKGIARGYYRITGSWDEPVVERVDAAEVREASAAGT